MPGISQEHAICRICHCVGAVLLYTLISVTLRQHKWRLWVQLMFSAPYDSPSQSTDELYLYLPDTFCRLKIEWTLIYLFEDKYWTELFNKLNVFSSWLTETYERHRHLNWQESTVYFTIYNNLHIFIKTNSIWFYWY